MSSILISTAIFCLLGVVGLSVYVALYGSHRVFQERFAEMTLQLQIGEGAGVFDQDHEPEGLGRTLFHWALQRMPKPKVSPASDRATQTLVRAGFIRSGALRTFQLIRLLAAVVLGVVAFVVATVLGLAAGRVIMIIVGSIAAGYFAPLYYLRKRANRRQKDIARQLSDVLDLLVVCFEAGLGLFEAIKIVGDETERQGQAIGTELALVSVEVGAGGSLGQALRNLAERTAVDDVRPLAATLIQSEQLGSQIGPALRSSSDSRAMRRFAVPFDGAFR